MSELSKGEKCECRTMSLAKLDGMALVNLDGIYMCTECAIAKLKGNENKTPLEQDAEGG